MLKNQQLMGVSGRRLEKMVAGSDTRSSLLTKIDHSRLETKLKRYGKERGTEEAPK